jgi:hypothetical protein
MRVSFASAELKMSTPQQKRIGWPEQRYIIDAGKTAPDRVLRKGAAVRRIAAIEAASAPPVAKPNLLQVRLHRFDQFLGAARSLGIPRRVDDMGLDMVFDHLGHEAVQGAARRDDQVQHRRAALLLLERALDRLDLAAHAADPIQELELFAPRLRHVDTPRLIG